jgi:hypothetical protein
VALGDFMRLPFILFGVASVFSTAALGDDCRCWKPSAGDIAAVEAKIGSHALPLGSLDRYARYYAGTISHDRRFIRGKLVPAGATDTSGIHIVEGRMLPLQGEGCITNSDPGGGPWLYLRCARPGAWTPSDIEIAEVEDRLQLSAEGSARPDVSHLPTKEGLRQHYARHYAGVTEDDRRIVVGVFVFLLSRDETPGVYIGSEAELPVIYDGSCGVINVRYDPSNKEVSLRCNGPFLIKPRSTGGR